MEEEIKTETVLKLVAELNYRVRAISEYLKNNHPEVYEELNLLYEKEKDKNQKVLD